MTEVNWCSDKCLYGVEEVICHLWENILSNHILLLVACEQSVN